MFYKLLYNNSIREEVNTLYRGNKYKSSMNHWYEWIDSIEFQELFEKIAVYVDDKIKESLDEFRKEIIDTYKINI